MGAVCFFLSFASFKMVYKYFPSKRDLIMGFFEALVVKIRIYNRYFFDFSYVPSFEKFFESIILQHSIQNPKYNHSIDKQMCFYSESILIQKFCLPIKWKAVTGFTLRYMNHSLVLFLPNKFTTLLGLRQQFQLMGSPLL